MSNVIDASFIGDFKLGDNINYNLGILKTLYVKNNERSEYPLNKPITLIIISIIEALLYDFHMKAKLYTREGIANIADKILNYIRAKEIYRFDKYINSAKKHNIFSMKDHSLYDNLDVLRKLRNRIHIQNDKNDFERDESDVFSIERMVLAEKILEKMMRTMSENHKRHVNAVNNFILPWESHYK